MRHQRNHLTAIGFGILLLLGGTAISAAAPQTKEYRLTINGEETQIDDGETITVKLANGKVLKIAVHQNQTKISSGRFFSFAHDRSVNVASADLGNGVVQYAMMSARGTVVMVHEFSQLDPGSTIEDFRGQLLNQLTKDDIELGAAMRNAKVRRQIPRGASLKGIKAMLSKGPDETIYELQGAGRGRRAILFTTKIDATAPAQDKKMIEDFWSTLDVQLR